MSHGPGRNADHSSRRSLRGKATSQSAASSPRVRGGKAPTVPAGTYEETIPLAGQMPGSDSGVPTASAAREDRDAATRPVPPPGTIKCVCFDWGGVILRHCRSWAEACQHADIEVKAGYDTPELVARRRQLNHDFQIGKVEEKEFFAELARATNGLYSETEVRTVHSAWLLREYRDVAPIIEAVNNRRGIETGLLSNTNAAHWRRHTHQGFKPADFPTIGLIKHRHASHLLGAAKPGSEIYVMFAHEVGCEPHEVLFFDDVAENVTTATALGWHARRIDHTAETAPQLRSFLRAYGILD